MSNQTPRSDFTHTAANGTRTSLLGSASPLDIAPGFADPRSRSAAGWRAHKGALA